ncbi:MAG: glycosyltransferase family 4 protein, partial [Gammaproteobacteria bacterium]|nr:glycosyltransferase family 4 protein [Gammaproteobacteria bacterium]
MIRGPKKACRSVDQIVVLSPGFKSQLFQRGVPENKVAVIYNWANEDAIDSIPDGRVPMGFPGRESFRFLFAGNIGTPQGLSAVLKAAKLLLVRGVPATIMFVGTGLQLEELKRNAAARSLAKVVFFPPVSMVEVGVYLKNAHALLVHLKAAELFKITIPSKTQA